ncbi:MAG: 2-polyprenyl-3-methyl-5-hydroxy-6-metoxy-1,4-benzoquinol methylase [Candidatus Azotimanducaceae bacterium]|jgi:2-polyprenyl-3-methyl-5-hydroxy-6-metoxy-1,4-benzoquinol methylase
MQLVKKGFERCKGVQTALDAPCGVGRATILLSSLGLDATGIDLGDGAVEVAQLELSKSGEKGRIEAGNLENLHFGDQAFDAVLCLRFYHHLPNDEIRHKIISELCRTAKKYVLISYFSPYSFTSIKRYCRDKLKIKKSIQHATTLSSLTKEFKKYNYQLLENIPQSRFFHTLHLAIYVKR